MVIIFENASSLQTSKTSDHHSRSWCNTVTSSLQTTDIRPICILGSSDLPELHVVLDWRKISKTAVFKKGIFLYFVAFLFFSGFGLNNLKNGPSEG